MTEARHPQPAGGVLDGREHVLPIRIYYEDTDFTGVVYHAAYVRFFERGRTECLRAAGVGHAALLDQDDPIAFTVVRLTIDYRRPARIDDVLVVRTRYERVKGPRLFVVQRILRGAELIAEAEVQAACIDLAGRPCRPTKALVDAIRPLLFQDTP
jgi:acyl-CoA thioester hydrolase